MLDLAGVLEQHSDSLADLEEALSVDPHTADIDRAVAFEELDQVAQKCRLAGAVGCDDGEGLAPPSDEAHVLQR